MDYGSVYNSENHFMGFLYHKPCHEEDQRFEEPKPIPERTKTIDVDQIDQMKRGDNVCEHGFGYDEYYSEL